MEKIKVTTKLVISCIIVSLFFLFAAEIAYNRMIYRDYAKIYEQMLKVENKINRLIDIELELKKGGQNVINR